MELNQIQDNKGARKERMRLGRGIGSGKGKTCARGHKGQKSRSGVAIKGFEGGQMPIYRRLPKRGFTNPNRVVFEVLNLGDLQALVESKKIDAKKPVTMASLVENNCIRSAAKGVKILGTGELKTALTLEVDKASKTAVAAIEKAGGKVSLTSEAPAA